MKHGYEYNLETEQSFQNKSRIVWSFMTLFINDLKQFELLFHTKLETFNCLYLLSQQKERGTIKFEIVGTHSLILKIQE